MSRGRRRVFSSERQQRRRRTLIRGSLCHDPGADAAGDRVDAAGRDRQASRRDQRRERTPALLSRGGGPVPRSGEARVRSLDFRPAPSRLCRDDGQINAGGRGAAAIPLASSFWRGSVRGGVLGENHAQRQRRHLRATENGWAGVKSVGGRASGRRRSCATQQLTSLLVPHLLSEKPDAGQAASQFSFPFFA